MLRSNFFHTETLRDLPAFFQYEFQSRAFFRCPRKGLFPYRGHQFSHDFHHFILFQAVHIQYLPCHSGIDRFQPQKQMLCPDVRMLEILRVVSSRIQCFLGLPCISVLHAYPPDLIYSVSYSWKISSTSSCTSSRVIFLQYPLARTIRSCLFISSSA